VIALRRSGWNTGHFDDERQTRSRSLSGLPVDKVGEQWKLEIRGANDPNRATVLLDRNFNLIEVTKNPAVQRRAPTCTSHMDSTPD
jgi:hypothetical protein